MINILAIYGSPRRGGNTDRLMEAFLAGAAPATLECRRVKVGDMEFCPCTGCQECDAGGTCVVDDAMQDVYRWIGEADLVVLASPIYFYGLTAQAKAIVDRSQALWVRKHRLGLAASRPKSGFLIAAGGSKGTRLFECAELTMRYFCDALDARYLGSLTFRSLDARVDIDRHPEYVDSARETGRRIANEVATAGGSRDH
jgi:multimeric flavodoxin WrbA